MLEQQIEDKITIAKHAVAEKKRRERIAKQERERAQKIQAYCEKVRERLRPIQESLLKSLEDCRILGDADPHFEELQNQLDEINDLMDNPESMAEQLYEEEREREEILEQQKELEEIVLSEERRIEQELCQWRQDLLQDLLQTIEKAENFFEASDIAIYVKDYKDDLLSIESLELVLRRLIDRINELNTRGTSPLELRQPEATLNYMADFALKQRMQGNVHKVNGGPAQLRQSHRQQVDRPFEYRGINGKVVVFGGHPRMHRNVARRLPDVNLIWFDQERGIASVADRSDVVRDADLVVLVTAYTSHKMQKIAQMSCDSYGLTLVHQNSTGISSMLELIAVELKKKRLADKFPQ